MKVKDLEKMLKSIPNKNAEILMSSDEEGNSYHETYELAILNDEQFILYPNSYSVYDYDLPKNWDKLSEEKQQECFSKLIKQR